jgi:hypothetical protein
MKFIGYISGDENGTVTLWQWKMFKRNPIEWMGGYLIVSPQTPAFTKIA